MKELLIIHSPQSMGKSGHTYYQAHTIPEDDLELFRAWRAADPMTEPGSLGAFVGGLARVKRFASQSAYCRLEVQKKRALRQNKGMLIVPFVPFLAETKKEDNRQIELSLEGVQP